MKTKLILLIVIVFFIGSSSVFAKGFQPPSKGKAVVYFVRVTSWGGASSFEFFHQDKYIGVFKKVNYIRYECDPGEQLFWASTENKEFITADLKEGGSYIIIVDVIMGAWKPRVGFNPITYNDVDIFERAKDLINKKDPVITPDKKIEEMNVKLKPFIEEKLEMYNTTWKNEKDFKHISPDMAIPESAMQ